MNKVVLMGRLTKDPETRYTQTNNTLVASFTLAINRRFARQGEERQADFIPIVGRIQTRNWDDEQGQKHYVTEVIAEEAYFADSRRDGAGDGFENTFGTTVAESQEFQVSSDDDLPF